MATPATEVRKRSGKSWHGFFAVFVASLGVVWLVFGLCVVVGASLLSLAGAMTVPDSTFINVVLTLIFAIFLAIVTVVFPAFVFFASAKALWKCRAK
jgi:hypothetical protein